jgi:hypothetical protein
MVKETNADRLRALCDFALLFANVSPAAGAEAILKAVEPDVEVAGGLFDALRGLPIERLSADELESILEAAERVAKAVTRLRAESQDSPTPPKGELAEEIKAAVKAFSEHAAPKIPYLSVAQEADLASTAAWYQFDQRPPTQFTAETTAILNSLRTTEYAVLVGRNNCGKSFILKHLTQSWGENCSYLGPARYQNFNLLGFYTPNRNRKYDKWHQFSNQWSNQSMNVDNSPLNLQQAIAELSDSQRNKLIEIVKLLLGVTLEMRHTVEDNTMSQKYISCGGHNISYTSSGLRLITALVTCLLDSDYDTVLVDEPELGISPEAQGLLADFLFNRQLRAKYFPHIKTLIFATHSTVFLDRLSISNNYQVEKLGDTISITQIETQANFNRIHFFLLGNRFETLYLPSAIVIVEGKTDHKFIERALTLKFTNLQLSVIPAHGDDRIKQVVNIAKSLLTDIQKSPYRDRIVVVLDSTHQKGLPNELVAMGVRPDRIVVWPKNGIEHLYPPSILAEIFGAPQAVLSIKNDAVVCNGREYRKDDLAQMVVSRMTKDTEFHPEFQRRLILLIETATGATSIA